MNLNSSVDKFIPCDHHFTEKKVYELDEIEIDAKKWAVCDQGNEKKRGRFNLLDNG